MTLFTVSYVLLVINFLVYTVECAPCSKVESLDVTSGAVFSNGTIVHEGIAYQTWYEDVEDGVKKRYACPCIGRVCIWKCCGIGKAYFNSTCSETDFGAVNPFSPPVYNGKERSTLLAHEAFFYMTGRPCDDTYLVDPGSNSNEELYIQEDGRLLEVSTGGEQYHEPTMYCADMMTNRLTDAPRLVAIPCFPEDVASGDSSILYIAYAIGLMISVPFLLATFLVYAIVPQLRNLHGMCQMSYCAGLIVAYPLLAYLKLHTGQIGVAMTGCLVIAFIIYYAFQTSFFWLNVMCFDIWRTFSGNRGGSTNKRREMRRFCMYGLYAWGVPLILTGITASLQFSDVNSSIITPGFGSQRCWFVDWVSELVFFFTPVLVLVVCNVVFFSVTAHRIRSIKQETAILKGSESSRNDRLNNDKQRYALYLKLFIVMGVNWSVELISFAVGGSNWYWIVADLSNVALGVFIFFIFVWKKKVLNLVQGRVRQMFGLSPRPFDSLTTRWTTNNSSAPTEDTRVSADETAIRLKDMH